MATELELAMVRRNTGTTNVDPFEDDYVNELIDEFGVSGTTFTVWQQLAASYSALVDTTEAGASHKFSDLFKHATAMATHWKVIYEAELVLLVVPAAPKVNSIVRE